MKFAFWMMGEGPTMLMSMEDDNSILATINFFISFIASCSALASASLSAADKTVVDPLK